MSKNPISILMQTGARTGTQQSNQNDSPVSIINAIKNSNNPNAMLRLLANKNPNVANVMNLVAQNGGDPKQAFYVEARKRGIDPNQILNMLK